MAATDPRQHKRSRTSSTHVSTKLKVKKVYTIIYFQKFSPTTKVVKVIGVGGGVVDVTEDRISPVVRIALLSSKKEVEKFKKDNGLIDSKHVRIVRHTVNDGRVRVLQFPPTPILKVRGVSDVMPLRQDPFASLFS